MRDLTHSVPAEEGSSHWAPPAVGLLGLPPAFLTVDELTPLDVSLPFMSHVGRQLREMPAVGRSRQRLCEALSPAPGCVAPTSRLTFLSLSLTFHNGVYPVRADVNVK